tara:strand:+ start:258 stop:569 length:312 start_codon:yes stop_codon:yes gene_type:complete
MQHIIVLTGLLMSACATTHQHNFVTSPPANKQDCMNLFESIHEIQEQREIYRTKMDHNIDKFKSGKMSKRRFQKKRETWLNDEGELRSSVTTLYDIGYEYKCF